MTVVTDSSPLVILSKIDCFDVLKELFSHLYISVEVHDEVVVAGTGLPGAAEVAYAERVVAAFGEAEAAGSAAIQLDGKFIDYPILYRARRVLEKMASIRAKEEQR